MCGHLRRSTHRSHLNRGFLVPQSTLQELSEHKIEALIGCFMALFFWLEDSDGGENWPKMTRR
jgi:hypothetical protein